MKQPMTMMLAVAALISGAALAQTKEVTIGYQDMLDPYRVAQESKAPEPPFPDAAAIGRCDRLLLFDVLAGLHGSPSRG